MREVSARPRLPRCPKYEPSVFIFSFIILVFKKKEGFQKRLPPLLRLWELIQTVSFDRRVLRL